MLELSALQTQTLTLGAANTDICGDDLGRIVLSHGRQRCALPGADHVSDRLRIRRFPVRRGADGGLRRQPADEANDDAGAAPFRLSYGAGRQRAPECGWNRGLRVVCTKYAVADRLRRSVRGGRRAFDAVHRPQHHRLRRHSGAEDVERECALFRRLPARHGFGRVGGRRRVAHRRGHRAARSLARLSISDRLSACRGDRAGGRLGQRETASRRWRARGETETLNSRMDEPHVGPRRSMHCVENGRPKIRRETGVLADALWAGPGVLAPVRPRDFCSWRDPKSWEVAAVYEAMERCRRVATATGRR